MIFLALESLEVLEILLMIVRVVTLIAGPVDRSAGELVPIVLLCGEERAGSHGGASRGRGVHGGGAVAADFGRRHAGAHLCGHG